MKIVIISMLFTLSFHSYADYMIGYSLDMHQETDGGDAEEFSLTRTGHHVFIGLSMDRKQRFFVGQNIISWTKAQTKGESDDEKTVSLLELGPKFLYYLNKDRVFYLSYVYNFHVKGTSEESGDSSDINGTSSLISLGYHYKLGDSFLLGASFNVHSVSITTKTTDSNQEEVTDTYQSTFPMIEFLLRF